MKLKKIVALATSAVMAVSLLASCGSSSTQGHIEQDGKTIYTYYLNMYTQDSKGYAEGQDTNFAQLIREKFNVQLEYDRIPEVTGRPRQTCPTPLATRLT